MRAEKEKTVYEEHNSFSSYLTFLKGEYERKKQLGMVNECFPTSYWKNQKEKNILSSLLMERIINDRTERVRKLNLLGVILSPMKSSSKRLPYLSSEVCHTTASNHQTSVFSVLASKKAHTESDATHNISLNHYAFQSRKNSFGNPSKAVKKIKIKLKH